MAIISLCEFCGEKTTGKKCGACKTSEQRKEQKKQWEQENPDKEFLTARQIISRDLGFKFNIINQ